MDRIRFSFTLLCLLSTAGCSGDPQGNAGAGGDGGDGGSSEEQSSSASSNGNSNGNTSTGSGNTGSQSSGSGGQTAGCPEGITILEPGVAVTLGSNGQGNPKRDYCFIVAEGLEKIELRLSGGTCDGDFECTGDDVEFCLKYGEQPDPYIPDDDTYAWAFTPGGAGTYGTAALPGAWYVSQVSSANTLGFSGVSMTLDVH